MNEQYEFLNLRVKPAIGGFREASFILGIHIDGCVYLEKLGELKALANPPPGAQRYFSIRYLFRLAEDEKWLARAIRLIREHSRDLNSAKRTKGPANALNSKGFVRPQSKLAYRQLQRAGLNNSHDIPQLRQNDNSVRHKSYEYKQYCCASKCILPGTLFEQFQGQN